MKTRCRISQAVTAFLLLVSAAHADTTLVVQGSDGLSSTIQVRNGLGRLTTAGRDEYLIYDAAAGVITYVEPRERRYTQVSRQQLEANVKTVNDIQAAVQPYMSGMLASLPPAQRRMIEQRMGGALVPPAAGEGAAPEVRTIHRGSHTIAGLRCQSSGIVKNGRPAAEVCMATGASGKLSREDFETLEALTTFSRGMASSAGSMLGALATQFQFMATQVEGVPIAVRDLEQERRYQVTSVSDSMLSDALFQGYEHFEKREMPALMR
jgi:hypothetical protein